MATIHNDLFEFEFEFECDIESSFNHLNLKIQHCCQCQYEYEYDYGYEYTQLVLHLVKLLSSCDKSVQYSCSFHQSDPYDHYEEMMFMFNNLR